MTLSFGNITIDSIDAAKLAAFWSALLGRPVAPGADENIASIGPADASPSLTFLKVPDKGTGKNTMHIDLVAEDLTAQIARAVDLGAEHVNDFDEYGAKWATLSDPEGNLFDIVAG
ncbi:VOC family protein [Rhodococcus sp. NPDC059968]|uniref:VOC family protein n=1 Tax=Rhodococcus TaxID=1827 RepID=UPI003673125F